MTPASPQHGVAAAATAFAFVLATASCARSAGEAALRDAAPPPAHASASPASVEPPEAMLARVKADLAAQEGVPADSIDVVTTRGVVWKDAAMGCGEPGKSYPLVRIEGYLIVLEHEGRRFEYRARPDGPFVLCRRNSSGR